jgi:hypothetical protein
MRPALLLAGLVACGGHGGDDIDDMVNCDLETRDDEFAIGLSKVGDGGTLGFTLMAAEPAPPIRGDNTWSVQVNLMSSGDPVDGAAMIVVPFMPDHGHPAAKNVVIEPTGTAGEYELAPINFWMPGLWEVTIDAQSGDGDDVVVFRFCVPA